MPFVSRAALFALVLETNPTARLADGWTWMFCWCTMTKSVALDAGNTDESLFLALAHAGVYALGWTCNQV